MPESATARSSFFLLFSFLLSLRAMRADERAVAAGPAFGRAQRFSAASPAGTGSDERWKAAPSSRSVSPQELEIPDVADSARSLPNHVRGGARDDPSRAGAAASVTRKTAEVLSGFQGLAASGVTPPDPIVAAGPDHVVVAVNSSWAVYTKSGHEVFETTAFGWFLPQLNGIPNGALLPYDPQVMYDQFSGRWILVYSATDTTSQSWLLISVSSTSDPTAAWFSWALAGDINGTAPAGNFSDYPALGFDDTAIYIATNQFRYTDRAFDYAKIRVLDKAALYAGASMPTWADFWGLEDPGNPGVKARSLRPVRTFGNPGAEYLVSNSPFATRSFVTVWTLAGAGTAAASLSAEDIPVSDTHAPPRADQMGGSPGVPGCPTPCRIDTGTGTVTSAVYRNGDVWFAHTVADSAGLYSRARYARIGVSSRAVLEDEAFGADGCWYFYPAVAVDAGNNLAMVFGRSCTDEFAGVGLTARPTGEPSLEPSIELKAGEESYVLPVGNEEPVNRWGDFFGAALDPAAPGRIWVIGEYAGPRNTWRTWVAQAAAAPTSGSCVPDAATLCLGGGRYRATAQWRSAAGTTGAGGAVPITGDTGYFWFFDEANIEVVVKVLDGCTVNGRHWVFAAGLTDVEVTLAVTDTLSGAERTYTSPAGEAFAPIQDTSALPCP
jgi:hypothetical protein